MPRRYRGLGLSLPTLFCALLGGTGPQLAVAAENQVVTVVTGINLRTDSNLFRRPTATSDTVTSSYAGLRFDKVYSLQQFQFDVTQNIARYNQFSQFNNSATSYRAAWLWHLSPRLKGNLSVDRAQSLTPFEDSLGGTRRNLRTSESRNINAEWTLQGGWHLVGGASQREQRSEQSGDAALQPDFKANSVEAGVKYINAAGNSVALVQKATKGDYQNRFATTGSNDYTENLTDLRVNWRLSGVSSLTGSAGWKQRDSDNALQPHFSGPAASLTYAWVPTSKLGINLILNRDTAPIQDPSFSYTLRQGITVATTWQLTPKIGLHASLRNSDYKYRGSGSVPATGPAREDTLENLDLGLNWGVSRTLTLGAGIQHNKRTSNIPNISYSGTVAMVSASLAF